MDTNTSNNLPAHINYVIHKPELNKSDIENISDTPLIRDARLVTVEIAVQTAIFCLAVIGNGMVLLILKLKRSKLSRMNIMIVHLSVADLFVAFCNVLPQLIWDITGTWEGGDGLCRIVKYIQVVAMYASSYVLITTAIDRWLVICHPLTSHTWTNQKLHMMVAVAWVLALIFSVPQTIIFSLQDIGNGSYNCWATWEPPWILQLYITWFTVAVYIVPSALLMLAYGRICYEVWASMRNRDNIRVQLHEVLEKDGRMLTKSHISAPRAHVRGLSRAKVKTVKLTLTVIVCYLLCWGPFNVAQMWAAWDEHAPFQGDVMVIIMLLASLNSCVNPWIFFAFSSESCGNLHTSSQPRAAQIPLTSSTNSNTATRSNYINDFGD